METEIDLLHKGGEDVKIFQPWRDWNWELQDFEGTSYLPRNNKSSSRCHLYEISPTSHGFCRKFWLIVTKNFYNLLFRWCKPSTEPSLFLQLLKIFHNGQKMCIPHCMLQGMFLYLLVLKERYLIYFSPSDVGWVACGKDNKVKNR